MPRLHHSLLLRAYNISPLLSLVLRGTRTLDSAINEFRWLREHVQETLAKGEYKKQSRRLFSLCKRRERGEPLQYILGTQPFGELDIKCRPGVLIPRPETEAYTTYLAQILIKKQPGSDVYPQSVELSPPFNPQATLRVVDLCSGTGCIPLLLHSLLAPTFTNIRLRGWDISPKAISLARENLETNISQGSLPGPANATSPAVFFEKVDIFSDLTKQQCEDLKCDVLVSNPPYISQSGFNHQTTRSVRNFEPKLALVPNVSRPGPFAPEDVFYDRLIYLHLNVSGSRIILMEVGDDEQAVRVTEMALDAIAHIKHPLRPQRVQIWRDWPDVTPERNESREIEVKEQSIPIVGSGKFRAVVLFEQYNFA